MAHCTVSVHALFLLVACVAAVLLSGCTSTAKWYGPSEDERAIRDSLFTLQVTPNGWNIGASVALSAPLMESLRHPPVNRDSMDDAAWIAALQQHKRNVEQFYKTRFTLAMQFLGDSVWFHLRFPQVSMTHNGDAFYSMTCDNFKDKEDKYDSVRVVITVDTAAVEQTAALYRREYLLGRYSKTTWHTSLRLAH